MDKSKRILIVDSDASSRKRLGALVEASGHEFEVAYSGSEALAKAKLHVDLVLLGANMSGINGYEVTRQIREDSATRDLPVLMVADVSSEQDRLLAIEAGADDVVAKPVGQTELMLRMKLLLKMKEAQDQLKRCQANLEGKIQQRTSALQQALHDMGKAQRLARRASLETIYRLALAAEYKDGATAAHVYRISHYCAALARGLDMPPGEAEIIGSAGSLHDVGKSGIPETVLLKKGPFSPEEWEIMKDHTILGARILGGSTSEVLKTGEMIALSHHEKWNGTGYPNETGGQEIPLPGRITAVADVFDALTTERPYKRALSNEKAYVVLRESSGKHFDPQIVDVFFNELEEIKEIQKTYREQATPFEWPIDSPGETEPLLAAV